MRLIEEGVGHELGGSVHLDVDALGLRCTLDVPLDGQDRFTSFRGPSTQHPNSELSAKGQ